MKTKNIIAPADGINKYLPINLIKDTSWSDGNNVRFGVGYVEKVTGWKKHFTNPSARLASASYTVGEFVIPSTSNSHVYKCTIAGTTDTVEPTWPTTAGGTVLDGTVTWTEVGVNKVDGELMAIDNYYKFNGDQFLMLVTTRRVYYLNPITNTFIDITGDNLLTGSIDNPVFTENAQDLIVITNGVNPIKYWDGVATSIADLAGLTDCLGGVTSVRAKSMLFASNFLMLLNTTENGVSCPQRLRTSQINNIEKWKMNDNGSGEAFWGDLTDGVDWGQRLMPLGNYVVAYKERSIQVLSYVGGTLIWDKRPAIIGTGLLAPRAIGDLGDEHIFIGPDNIYSFDLIDPKIAGDDISKSFFEILDPSKSHLTTGFFIEETPEVWFVFVSTSSPDEFPDKALTYNTDTKAWSIRDMPMTAFGYYNLIDEQIWDTDEETWDSDDSAWNSSTKLANAPINLCGDMQGYIYVLDGHSKDGANLDCFIRTKLFDFENPFQLKRAKRIQFMVSREGPYNLQVRVGSAANVDEEITWSASKYMSLDKTSPPWVDIDITSRYMMFEFATLEKDQPFRITGYLIYYDERGAI